MFGRTLKLTENGDVYVSELHRFEFVEGVEKAAQDLRVLFRTVKGTDIFSPGFGFDAMKLIDVGYDPRLVELEVRRALAQYPHVKQVDDVEVGEPDENRRLPVTIHLTLRSGERLSVEVSV